MLHNTNLPSTLFRENRSPGDTVVSVLMLIVLILTNLHITAKFINTIRALITTRCYTNQPIQGGKYKEEPVVTIQICVYNDASVIEDTINAACNVDWPKDKLHVQICDDSTDGTTTDIIMAAVASWCEKGISCKCLTRPNRIGYKAGNLHYHTKAIQGDFVALFDSDHRAEPSFLRRAIPQFYDEDGNSKHNIGLVQFPWAYYNTHQNLLTEYDAMSLDTSHVIDQVGRSGMLKCFGFNGTGGVWRKEAIQAGGGWQWDTVTEDLDLSYLAHMAGYDLIYLRDLPQQLELPSGIRAHVQQKHRWTKGFFQVMRKSLWNVIKSPRSSLAVKFEAFFHFTTPIGYTLALCIFLLAPMAVQRNLFTWPLSLLGLFPAILPLAIAVITVYGKVAGSNGHYGDFPSRTFRLAVIVPMYYLITLGMIIFETYAIIDGLTSNDATFKRTPKEGASATTDKNAKAAFFLDPCEDLDEDDDDDDHAPDISCDCFEKEGQKNDIPPQEKTSPASKKENVNHMIPVVKRNRFICKHSKDACLGISGLIFAGYILYQACLTFLQSSSITPIQFLSLTPVPGLLYIHGSFCYALLFRNKSRLTK